MKSVIKLLFPWRRRKNGTALYLSPVLHVEVQFHDLDRTSAKELSKRVKQHIVQGCRVIVQQPPERTTDGYTGELRLMDGERLIFREKLKQRALNDGKKTIEFEMT